MAFTIGDDRHSGPCEHEHNFRLANQRARLTNGQPQILYVATLVCDCGKEMEQIGELPACIQCGMALEHVSPESSTFKLGRDVFQNLAGPQSFEGNHHLVGKGGPSATFRCQNLSCDRDYMTYLLPARSDEG